MSRPHPGEPEGSAAGNRLRLRKLVLAIVVLLVLVGAGLFGWKSWIDAERRARYAGWREQIKDDARRPEVVKALRTELLLDVDPKAPHAERGTPPDLPEAHEVLGEALARDGKFSDAAVELREAIKGDPNDVRAHRWLAQVCLRIDLVNEAKKTLEEALALADEKERPELELELGNVCLERYRGSATDVDFRAARNYFQDARRNPATAAEALDGYAMLFFMKGPDQDLERWYESHRELLEKYPDFSRAASIKEMLDLYDKRKAEQAAGPQPDAAPPVDKPEKKDGGG